ncbi:putative membrane protein [Microbacterium ginsengiterrae]|uniref:Putative membrane protein n=1 Tax=Microbacterium ginsengiterrae TaxID=546115 RepID=A0A7W9CDK0_9MICO|nr:hypothetical protein [Microbacterium ginsengiterrae]MBB5743648.1 putative membrane protein [Microbacterium ginsengiterrae]
MIDTFLTPPRTTAEWAADALRLIGFLSVVVALVMYSPTDAGILALATPALVAPRFVGLRGSADVVYCITVLVAAWSNVFDIYRTVVGWDIIVHFVATGVLAGVAYLLLARLGILPLPGTPHHGAAVGIVITTALGLALSALWEMIEWLGFTFISDNIFVEYDDTIGDMAAGGAGALVAGVLVAYVRLLDSRVTGAQRETAAA